MWRSFLSRSLFLFSLHSSSSSTTCPYFVRSSHFSSSNASSSNAPFSRRQKVKIRVWWDFDNCRLPTGVELEDVVPQITGALEAYGIRDFNTFKAIGNVRQLRSSRGTHDLWSIIEVSHIKTGGEFRACKVISDDIMYWVSRNPPPAHLFLISGDEAFAPVLNHLRMKNYNILIANNNTAPDHLCGAATVKWHWNSLVRGCNFIGKHFNHPPSDFHFKPSIEDGLLTPKYFISLNIEERSESAPDLKVGPDSDSELRSVRVKVLWDHDNCNLPTDFNILNVLPAITAALRANGIKGCISVTAFGDTEQLTYQNQRNRSDSGMFFFSTPNEQIKHEKILKNIRDWVSRNPPPQHLLLISGDEVFASVLNHLRLNKYNIMIASNNRAPGHLYGVATVMWHWNSLLRGEELIGKHVNNPPHDSWYGHFIEDDFSTSKYPTSLNTEEASESAQDSKVRPASDSVSESCSARVRVWWDLDNCDLPTGINAVEVGPALTAALKANGINGPIEIISFGDDRHLASANERANFWTGIDFNFISNGGKTDVFNAITIDLMSWVSKNPPPVHLFLISGDGDFGCVLNRLRMKNYNILIACIERAPDALCSAATIMWHWNSLVRGEELIGKHLNYPPDDSWYCHFKAPIEDALLTSEESTSLSKFRPTS